MAPHSGSLNTKCLLIASEQEHNGARKLTESAAPGETADTNARNWTEASIQRVKNFRLTKNHSDGLK